MLAERGGGRERRKVQQQEQQQLAREEELLELPRGREVRERAGNGDELSLIQFIHVTVTDAP